MSFIHTSLNSTAITKKATVFTAAFLGVGVTEKYQFEAFAIKSFITFCVKLSTKLLITDEARNEFFNSFINRVILYDDKILIFCNTDPNSPMTVDTTESKEICDLF